MDQAPSTLRIAFAVLALLAAGPTLAGESGGACGFGVVREVAGLNKILLDVDRDGVSDLDFAFGPVDADALLVGNWDDTGDNVAIRRDIGGQGKFFFNMDTDGLDELSYVFGEPGIPVAVGDWNGNGEQTLVVRRDISGSAKYFFDDGFGVAFQSYVFGDLDDTLVVGDWDADGDDDIGVVRVVGGALQWNLNTEGGAPAELVFGLGAEGDIPIVGDWDADGFTEWGIVRVVAGGGSQLIFTIILDSGSQTSFPLGDALTDTPAICDWNGDGLDDGGVIRRVSDQLRFLTRNLGGVQPVVDRRFGNATDTGIVGVFEGLTP